MKKTEETPSFGGMLAAPVLCGLVLTLLAMLLGAALVRIGRLPQERIPVYTACALCFGCLTASLSAARRAPRNRLLCGLGAGAVLLGCLVALSLTWFSEPASPVRLAINAVLAAVSSFVGAFIGSRRRRKRKKRRKKHSKGG